MRNRVRRTDVIIIICILLITIACIISGRRNTSQPVQEHVSVTIEDYNGKTLGTMSGSQFETVTVEKFPDSPIAYYTGVSELYTALTSRKIALS
jgi:hypothetical protein